MEDPDNNNNNNDNNDLLGRREREEGDDRNDRPNQQQRVGDLIQRGVPFIERIPLSLNNVSVHQSTFAGGMNRPVLFPANTQLITLESLLRNGCRHGSLMILVILSINNTQSTQNQQPRFGGRNNTNQASTPHSRSVMFMCPISPSGSNTAIMFHGGSTNATLFNCDLASRDDGTLRKYLAIL